MPRGVLKSGGKPPHSKGPAAHGRARRELCHGCSTVATRFAPAIGHAPRDFTAESPRGLKPKRYGTWQCHPACPVDTYVHHYGKEADAAFRVDNGLAPAGKRDFFFRRPAPFSEAKKGIWEKGICQSGLRPAQVGLLLMMAGAGLYMVLLVYDGWRYDRHQKRKAERAAKAKDQRPKTS